MWLTFADVTCGYDRRQPVLQHLDFRLGPGIWAVTGPNGSGKSTLLRCAAGLLPPLAGQMVWNGEDAYRLDARFRYHLGYATQESGGYPDLTVHDYLSYLAAMKGLRPGRSQARIADVLRLTGLSEAAGLLPAVLSGGMKSRLRICQALLNDPDLLLLDEPAEGLDPQERIHFRNLLQDLARERIVLIATNILSDAEGIAAGFIRLRHGRLEAFED